MAATIEDAQAAPAPAWDEAKCEDALAQLETLQEQLDGLRLAIPSIIHSFTAPHDTPAQLLAAFGGAAQRASDDIKDFRTSWNSPDIRAILERSKESRQTNPDLSACVKVPGYGWRKTDWIEDGLKSGNKESEDTTSVVKNAASVAEDIGKLVENFREAHEDFDVMLENENRLITISFKTQSINMTFVIQQTTNAEGADMFDAECRGTLKLVSVITRCLKARPRQDDLSYLLNMIAAYTSTHTAPCARCGKLLDNHAFTPAARRSRMSTSSDGMQSTVWDAIHESCL